MRLRGPFSHLKADDGASAVEFGLIAPVLFLLVLGIMQFGLIFFQSMQVESAAREGARIASLRYTGAEVVARARAAAPGVDLTGAGAIVVTPADPSSTAVAQNSEVAVSVTSQVPVILPFMSAAMDPDGDGNYRIASVARQRIE